jgi:hypothetical protein
MKRLAPFAIALTLIFVFAPRADAQTSPMRLGLTGGASTSSVGGSSVTLGNWKWGGVAGVFGQYFLARETYIGLDANWVQKGGSKVALSGGEAQDLDLEYIELPLTIGYRQRFDGWESNLYIGLALSFQISCKVKGSSSSNSVDCDDQSGLAPKKTTDWSIPFGLGFYRNLGGSLLGIDIRYMLGLSDVFENSNIRNRSWQFTAKWAVPIGG